MHPGILAVILDVKLPDISGYEVCRRIKANPATSALPVLQISASFADPTLRAKGLQGGADAYVAQPVEPAELLALVGALIRSHESERTLRFQAEISRKLGQSIEYDETLRNIAEVFSPRFADRCHVLLRPAARDVSGLERPHRSIAKVVHPTHVSGAGAWADGGGCGGCGIPGFAACGLSGVA